MKLRILALLLSLCLLLAGCFGTEYPVTAFSDMEYIRPDMAELEDSYAALCEAAQGEDVEAVVDAIYDFYDVYDWFQTCYSLSDIHYSADLRDTYWEREYTWCAEHSAQADALLEEMSYMLAESPCREALEAEEYFGEGYFDDYDGENLWDDVYSGLLTREAALVSEYYDLSEQAGTLPAGTGEYYDACGEAMAQVLVELIEVRQEMAAYWGYDNYPQFASDSSYYRDYTPEQMEAYLEAIRENLTQLYIRMNTTSVWQETTFPCSEKENFRFLKQAAKNMGGSIWDAFQVLEAGDLYDITYSQHKYPASYELYLTWYAEPYIFLYPDGTQYDKLAFAHEFGHFCNDYICYGSYAGVDVAEFYSMGMEYLILCYGEDSQSLRRLKMADSLSVFVEQAAFASFEQQMYSLTGENLTVENLCALYEKIALDFGFDSLGFDRREFVDITHFYTNPLYLISYVVSNDAAMQLYRRELEEPGSGLALMERMLPSQEAWFLAFLEEAGLESPFRPGRMEALAKEFETCFG